MSVRGSSGIRYRHSNPIRGRSSEGVQAVLCPSIIAQADSKETGTLMVESEIASEVRAVEEAEDEIPENDLPELPSHRCLAEILIADLEGE